MMFAKEALRDRRWRRWFEQPLRTKLHFYNFYEFLLVRRGITSWYEYTSITCSKNQLELQFCYLSYRGGSAKLI